MSDDVAISVEGLSKSYLIGHQAARRNETFREMLGRRAHRVAKGLLDVGRGRQIVHGDEVEEFWALRDVAFDVRRGEVLGVIGRNGAGKSTLLKILSRITEPTKGRAVIRGRVSSLLEVGTGFHPELTGRENIFLNGAILGMSRAEIAARFDEIVDFAEVDRFLDTPVKRYSSGMYVRLAFAVAAHLEPEILIIDEVLAVGDVAFQKKCLGKMQTVARDGRTVLFVSHNLPTVVDLTSRAMLLEGGRLAASGPSAEVVSEFLRASHARGGGGEKVAAYRRESRTEDFVDIAAVSVAGEPFGNAAIAPGGDIAIEVGLDVHRPVEGMLTVNVFNEQFQPVVTLASEDSGFSYRFDPGRHSVRCTAAGLPLVPGLYYLSVGVQQPGGRALAWDVVEMLPGFHVDRDDRSMSWPGRPGVLLTYDCDWAADPAPVQRVRSRRAVVR